MQLGRVGAQPSPVAWLRPGPCIRGGLAPASFGCKWGSYETGTWTSSSIGRHEGDREIGTRTEGTRTEGEPPLGHRQACPGLILSACPSARPSEPSACLDSVGQVTSRNAHSHPPSAQAHPPTSPCARIPSCRHVRMLVRMLPISHGGVVVVGWWWGVCVCVMWVCECVCLSVISARVYKRSYMSP